MNKVEIMKSAASIHSISQGLPPTILTIFGATGDLSANYLLPALYHMEEHKLLPENFRLVCVGRREFDTGGFLNFILKKSRVLKLKKTAVQKRFLKRLTYYRGNLEDPASFRALAQILSDHEQPKHTCFNRLYYFATSPQLFDSIVHVLKDSGLLMSCKSHERKIRVLVEKPFGFNFKSAQALNRLFLKFFEEEQIYRIDHYLGKETVQNLMVVRFANRLFEPLWNKDFVDHIEVSVLYDDRLKQRAYFDQAGMLRDVIQNHALEMLSLILMDEPKNLATELIRDEKLKILKALRPFTVKDVKENLIKGQYQGYIKDIGQESQTETYVALKAFVDTPRWQGVPLYLRAGKALNKKITEISIHFKELKRCLFKGCAGNILIFRIQPDESVHLQINNKIPGFGVELHQALLNLSYKKTFKGELPGAYERLLLDFMQGDQRLFIRSDEIEAAWKFIDSITDNWSKQPLYFYKPSTLGPKEAEGWIKRDLREWWTK